MLQCFSAFFGSPHPLSLKKFWRHQLMAFVATNLYSLYDDQLLAFMVAGFCPTFMVTNFWKHLMKSNQIKDFTKFS